MASPSPRRKDALAVHSLQRFVFSVPDLADAAKFYRAFGLDVREVDGRLDLYAFGHPHRWASIYQRAGGKRLEYIALGAYAEDYDALVKRLGSLGVPSTAPHPLADDEGVWIADPEGIAVEIVRADKVSPDGRRDPAGERVNGKAAAPARSKAPRPRARVTCRTSSCSRRMSCARWRSTATCLACAFRITRVRSSRSCTARTAATTTCSRSRSRTDRDWHHSSWTR